MRNDNNAFVSPDNFKTRTMARIKKTATSNSRTAASVAGERTAIRQILQEPIGFSEVAAEAIVQARYNSIEAFRTMMIGDAVSEFFKNLTMEYNRKDSPKRAPIIPKLPPPDINVAADDDDDDEDDEEIPISRSFCSSGRVIIEFPNVAQQNLRTFLFHMKICDRLGQPIDPSKFTAD
jgi:hypothetical protein